MLLVTTEVARQHISAAFVA